MGIYGSVVLLARHCPTIENRCFARQAGRMILVAKRHRFTAMEIYGSVVLLARHCPNIENRCFARQAGGEGGIRTHGPRKGTAVFETARFGRSRTSPEVTPNRDH